MIKTSKTLSAIALLCVSGAVVALAQPAGKKSEERERKVTEKEVPAIALAALKKASGSAKLNQIEEEIEDGFTFYEGQWTGPDGRVEALVTDKGDLVEIEELVPADKVPAAVRAAAEKESGKEAKAMWEKKTAFTYEVHFKKDGKHYEMLYAPTGAKAHEEGDGQDSGNDEDE